jgi:hypothetical protein
MLPSFVVCRNAHRATILAISQASCGSSEAAKFAEQTLWVCRFGKTVIRFLVTRSTAITPGDGLILSLPSSSTFSATTSQVLDGL